MALTLNQKLRQYVGDSFFGANYVEEKLEKALRDSRVRAEDPKTFFFDPMTQFFGQAWLPKASGGGTTFNDLRAMSQNPVIAAIIQTRLNQMSLFMVPQQDEFSPGYRIVSDDPVANLDLKKKKQLSDFLLHAGLRGWGELSLDMFMRKFMRDSLVMDQACSEIVPRRNTRPAYFIPVDGATIRLLRTKPLEIEPSKKPRYAQILQDRVVATYNEDEMLFGIRNPSTDIRRNGYGTSELEVLVGTVATILNTERFNNSLVAQGGTNKGILVVQGDAPKGQLDAFKRDFREAVRNAAAYWRPPVIQIAESAKVDWVTLDKSNRDIEYAQLFDFLVKEATSVYNIHPEEIGWSVKATGARATFSSGDMSKISHSLEKGLKPLLRFVATMLTECIISRLDPRYAVEFRGVNVDKERDIKNKVQEVSNWKTVNEMRVEVGLVPIPGWDIVLNQNLIFWLNAQTQDTSATNIDTSVVEGQNRLNRRETENAQQDRARNTPSERTLDDRQDERDGTRDATTV